MNGPTQTATPPFLANGDLGWEIRGFGDLNGDTHPDVIWQHATLGRLAVWFFTGTTLLSTEYIDCNPDPNITDCVEPDLNWKIMAAADMDQDGRTDLVWQHLTTGYLRIWHMTGQQMRDSMDVLLNGSPHTVGANSQWRLAGIGDLNGDLWPDFVWRNYAPNDGGLAAWYMTDRTISATVWLYPAANTNLDWKLVGVADIAQNGVRDGKPDLIWQNPVSGYLGLWYMDGVQTVQTIYLTPNSIGAGTTWRLVGVK
jgi:hypothetical protein